jgi:hypothetical protein
MYAVPLVVVIVIDVIQEAMCKFLEALGVLPTSNYTPDDPDNGQVKAYEEFGLMGPDSCAPCICLKQTFKGKWNKEVVEILMSKFISAVKQGIYNPVQHTWSEMAEDNVRKRCQTKLYRMQQACLKVDDKGPKWNKINRTNQRRQDVCLLVAALCEITNIYQTYHRRRKICNLN